MYEKLIEFLEKSLDNDVDTYDDMNKKLEAIIKIKTIKYMDLQTEILEASRRVSRN